MLLIQVGEPVEIVVLGGTIPGLLWSACTRRARGVAGRSLMYGVRRGLALA